MKNQNKLIFTFCLLIGCFIFSDKVLAFTLSQEIYEVEASTPESQIFNRYGCSGCSEDKINAKSFDNYMDLVNNNNYSYSKILLGGVIAHPSCRNKSHDLLTPTDNGMPICARDAMNVQASYYETPEDSPEKTNYIDNRTKIIKTYEHISYFVSRLDSYANYQIISNTDWEFSWGLNNKMGVSIYPEMKLKYNIKDKINTENEKWKNRVITGIKIEAVNGNYETYYTQGENQLKNNNTANQLDVYAVRNFTVTQHYNDDNPSVATIDEEGNTTRPSNYTEYSYTINIPKLLANENNGLYGMGYNGTTINNDMLNDTINSVGSYTKNFKGEYNKGQQKQWSFHYLLPLKETITYVVITDKYDECVKDVSLMTSEEKTECCNYNGILKNGKTFAELNPNLCNPCEGYRKNNDKDNYVKNGCCVIDSANASSGWCCKDDTYFNNNKTKCCSSEKSTSYKGLYFPDKLASQFDEVCCKDQVYFDTSDNKKICCEKEKATSFRGFYFPDIYAFRYDEKCGKSDGELNCKDESTFNANHDYCCAKSKANGKSENYIPSGKTYAVECETKKIEKNCENSESYFNGHRKSCCDIPSYPSGKKAICDNLKPDTSLSCVPNSNTETKSYDNIDKTNVKISTTEAITFSQYTKSNALTLESGTGFEYPITVNHEISFNVDYNTDGYSDEEAIDKAVKSINDETKEIANNFIENQDQKYIFHYKDKDNEEQSIEMKMVKENEAYDFPELSTTTFNEEFKYSQLKIEPDGTISTESGKKQKSITIPVAATLTYKLILPRAYINKSTGEVTYNEPSDMENYYDGGNKLYTNISDEYQYNNFYITYTSKVTGLNIDGFSCEHLTLPCITRDICNKKEDNGYFYRRISLTKPFPNRGAGSNWGKDDIALRSKYIWKNVNANSNSTDNATSIYSGEPMYEITLTSELINQIKEYNSKTTYFDWNMDNNKDKQSTSKFLSGTASGASFMNGKVKFESSDKRTEKFGEPNVEVSE